VTQTLYLSIHEVLELHSRTIDIHGGKEGVRDMGLLESALLRCQSGYYTSLSEQGASLLESLCMNHCFMDGNKRVALLATIIFFKLNGYNIKSSNKQIVSFIIKKVIVKKIGFEEISKWFEARLVPIS
jgi:death-on-curing protein